MIFYSTLALASAVCVTGAYLLWWKTRSLAFPFGMAALYFWSLHGGWAIIYDNLGGDSGKLYHGYFKKIVSVELDNDYLASLALYGAFIAAVALTAFLMVRPRRQPLGAALAGDARPLHISHGRVLFWAGAAGLASLFIVRGSLSAANAAGISAYHALSMSDDPLIALHQLLDRVALLPLAIGIATYASGKYGRFLTGTASFGAGCGYAAAAACMLLYCFLIGAKNETFHALVTGGLFYLQNCVRPRLGRLVLCGALVFGAIAYVDFTRGASISELKSVVNWSDFFASFVKIFDSNEAYTGHMSLYAVITEEVPFTYGSSFVSLTASVVPRALWPDRPDGIFTYYVREVGAVEGQGYTIHHATGWYLNFGVCGLLAGGVLLGWVWARLFNWLPDKGWKRSSLALRLIQATAFFTFSGGMQVFVRAGIEAYKAMAVLCLFAPIVVLWCATRTPSGAGRRPASRAGAMASGRG